VFDFIKNMLLEMAPLRAEKSPQAAAFLGFVLGGVGLGLYFLSFVDALIPLGIAIAITVVADVAKLDVTFGFLAGGIIASLYGYFRAETSNAQLSAARQSAVQT